MTNTSINIYSKEGKKYTYDVRTRRNCRNNMICIEAHLAHEQDGVEDDEQHDEVLKGRGGDQPPDMVASSHLGLGDVDFLRSYRHHVRYTRFLRIELRIIIFVLL